MKAKALVAAVVLFFVGIGAYWHFSPHIALHSMQSAAKARDAETFNDYVDFPALRESMKGQLTLMMADTMSAADKGNPFAALGAMMGAALVNQMIDGLVRPETVMRMMANGDTKPSLGKKEAPPTSGESVSTDAAKTEKKWQIERINSNKVIAFVSEDADLTGGRSGLVFVRSGFATWRLTEMRLPASTKSE